jgi:hypothetical protein
MALWFLSRRYLPSVLFPTIVIVSIAADLQRTQTFKKQQLAQAIASSSAFN